MSARDDYPWLANRERRTEGVVYGFDEEIGPALDEIDRLRAEVEAAKEIIESDGDILWQEFSTGKAPWPSPDERIAKRLGERGSQPADWSPVERERGWRVTE